MKDFLFNKIICTKIKRTVLYKKIKCESTDEVYKMIESLDNLGGIVNNVPHDSIVLIYRLSELCVPTDEVIVRIKQSENRCSRFILLFFIRLSKDFNKHQTLFKSYLSDYKKVEIITEQNDRKFEYFDVLIDDLLEKKYLFGIYLKEYKFD